jgi:hypothetical protein
VKAYLPMFVYAAVYLVIASGFLFYYFNKRQPKLYDKWWVLLVVLIFLALAGREAYKGVHQVAAQRIPSTNELENSLNNSGSIASDEVLYKSPDGYQILIPRGLTYTGSKGVVSLIAMNRNSPKTSLTLVVMKQSSTQPVDGLVKELVLAGAKANPPKTYVFEENGKNTDQRRGYIEGSNNGVLIKTALLLAQHGTSIYRVAISTPKDNFEREQEEIEKVLGSFKVL